jgi:hypothetical protein
MSKVISSFQMLHIKLMFETWYSLVYALTAPIISILKWLMVKVKANMSSALDKI